MRVYRAENETRGSVLAERVRFAGSFLGRCRGLLGTRPLAAGDGLWLQPCRSIHTLFMRYPIEALFLDGDRRIVHAGVYPPWRMSRFVPRSRGVLELSPGALERSGTQVGDAIRFTVCLEKP